MAFFRAVSVQLREHNDGRFQTLERLHRTDAHRARFVARGEPNGSDRLVKGQNAAARGRVARQHDDIVGSHAAFAA